jgi:saccharopine dehydrogenase (NADP+, L-glutamate forming)
MSGEKGATYLVDGKVKMLPYHEVLRRSWPVEVEGIGTMEAYPNRDSIYYRKLFGLGDAETMIRGTLRYPGWCETWHQIVRLGMPNEGMRLPSSENLTYRDVSDMFLPVHTGEGALEGRVADFLGISPTGVIMNNMRWLGLFSDEPVPRNVRTVTDALSHLLQRKLRLGPEDRDMVIIMHDITARYSQENERVERIVSTMIEYGDPGGLTAMSKAVGLPTGIAATLILTGKLELAGCQIATHPSVYKKVLAELERSGVTFSEMIERVD